MRILGGGVLALAALAACAPAVPDSGAGGVGFDSYSQYEQRREAQLSAPVASAPVPLGQPYPAGQPTAAPQTIGQEAMAALGKPVTSAAPLQGAPLQATTVQPAPIAPLAPLAPAAPIDNGGISDEQDFSAVSSRESIESDKQRIAQNRAQYQVVPPAPLPARTDGNEPNIVAYALAAKNRVGEQVYSRANPLRNSMFERNCAKFASSDLAQEAFLKSGGPNRDPKSLDPDGDGYACRWDPTPFQKVRGTP